MNLKNAYRLSIISTKPLVIGVAVPHVTQTWLRSQAELSNQWQGLHHYEGSFSNLSFKPDPQSSFEQVRYHVQVGESAQLQDLALLLKALNGAPAKERGPYIQALRLNILTGDPASIGGEAHRSFFQWALNWLGSGGGAIRTRARKVGALAWDACSNQILGKADPDDFQCTAFSGTTGVIAIGRVGGNVGAGISLDGDEYRLVQHNAAAEILVWLLLSQLASLEGSFWDEHRAGMELIIM